MARLPATKATKRSLKQFSVVLVAALSALVFSVAWLQAAGNQLQQRYVKLSAANAGATGNYLFGFTPIGLDTLETIDLQVCANDPMPGTPCTAPSGFDASSAVLVNQTGDTGFSISPLSTANDIVLMRPPLTSNGQPDTYEFQGIVNPDTEGSYYVRIRTFQDTDMTGSPTNFGGLAFAINGSISVTATVPPYLLFCVGVTIPDYTCNNITSGNYVNFGELSSSQANQGDSQMLVATNAKDGYSLRVGGSTMTSGNNVIPAMPADDVSRPGVGQFGLNLRANSAPQGGLDPSGPGSGLPTAPYDQINFFQFVDGDVIAGSSAPDDSRKYTATYIVNVPKGQAPGVYVTTITYIALGSF